MTPALRHAVRNHEHLTEEVSEDDGNEMRDFLGSALKAISGGRLCMPQRVTAFDLCTPCDLAA
eukprot:scaffold50372_cov41-Prasinocladus_malaysianus.AAC.1